MPTIRSLLSQVVKDRRVTADEWKTLAQAAEKLPKTAGASARKLLNLWADDRYQLEDAAREGLRDFLRTRGYPVPYGAPTPPTKGLADELAKQNLGETDTDFAALAKATGQVKGDVTLAVLDGGFSLDHPELAPRTWTNSKEIPNNGKDDDRNGKVDDVHGWNFDVQQKGLAGAAPRLTSHGTWSAAVATAGTTRLKQIACTVPLREGADPKGIADAIDYAAKNGARVVNMSFYVMNHDGSSNVPGRVEAVRAAMARHPDVLFVLAAGNSGANQFPNPGVALGKGDFEGKNFLAANQLPNLVVVAAADPGGHPAGYSNYGVPFATVATPADHFSPDDGGGYTNVSPGGTSLAAPVATNIAAKCLALDPTLKPADVKKLLTLTADAAPEWKGMVESGGVSNAKRAMTVAAMRTLVKSGLSQDDAAKKLKVTAKEKPAVLAALKELLPASIKTPRGTTPA